MLVKEGEKAPDFTLQSDEAQNVSLSDFRGRNVVLYFCARATAGCTREAVQFRDLAQEFEKQDIVILGVSKDSVKSHQNFKQKNGLPFTLLSDPEAKVLNQYGVWKEKKLYGRTFMGTERTTFLIDEKGFVQKIFRNVKVKGHAQVCLLNIANKT